MFLAFTCIVIACKKDDTSNEAAMDNIAAFPYDNLSDYGFFTGDIANLISIDAVLPYDLNTPLFSDYSQKARYIYIPNGKSANYVADFILDFPTGTILIKTFYFLNNIADASQGKQIIETRLLVKYDNEWEVFSYIWDEEQTEASFTVLGEQRPISWTHYNGETKTANYLIPNKNECKSCHLFDEEVIPIGPKARNLNRLYDYSDGSKNQLDKWVERGWLTGLPNPYPYLPVWDDESTGNLNDRARAYLDVNCAHCHYSGAPADNSGLFLNYTNVDSLHLGICKPPVAAGQGSGGLQADIIPGDPDASIMVYRMNSNDLEVQMPEISRSVIHTEGLELIREWIASLEGDCTD